MTILYKDQVEVRQCGGGNGDEVPPREEDVMTITIRLMSFDQNSDLKNCKISKY
jgi:hypothetical protein